MRILLLAVTFCFVDKGKPCQFSCCQQLAQPIISWLFVVSKRTRTIEFASSTQTFDYISRFCIWWSISLSTHYTISSSRYSSSWCLKDSFRSFRPAPVLPSNYLILCRRQPILVCQLICLHSRLLLKLFCFKSHLLVGESLLFVLILQAFHRLNLSLY